MKFLTLNFWRILIMSSIICVGIVFRLYKINNPLAGWHSFRQTDTAAVARSYVSQGIDLLHPRYEDLSNIQSGKDNPKGWRMVEFPIYQGIAAYFTRLFPSVSIEVWLRLLTITASMITAVLLGILVARRTSIRIGMLTMLVWSVLPYSIYYGRAILPEEFAVCMAITSIFFADIRRHRIYMIIMSGLFGALAILVKPVTGFLLLPIVYLFIVKRTSWAQFLLSAYWYACIVFIPFILWRVWISQFPEGIPVFAWLFNKDDIRFKGAWFYWLFAERVGNLILGYWGLIPFGIGMSMSHHTKEDRVFPLIALGSLLYLAVVAGGNVQHDYYQIVLLPIISFYVAKGIDYFIFYRTRTVSTISIAMISCVFAWAFSWYTIRTYYWINHPEIVEAGKAIDQLLPKDAKVIAPYNGDTTFLYQTKRQGWPLGFDIDKKIEMGATHYVTAASLETDWEARDLANKYTVIITNSKYTIIDLTKKNPDNL